ncbi:glycosyltransferase [Winogradskyella sp. 3972H.M.0a.05]|uniref:glycosyltransferase family 2 protein n=1 Tax=Winogradskyella sp. 3972H.M.0a.05 TaxID=2950277 RepID=UPI00339AEC61
MLSILIPTYNYDVFSLVQSLHKQAIDSGKVFEILVFDDGSKDFIEENNKINTLDNASYTVLDENIGRSAIRNLLAQEATYDTLLFLDADVAVLNDNFLMNYLEAITDETQIIYGGIVYSEKSTDKDHVLRWVYGRQREALPLGERLKNPYLRFLTLSFLIQKDVFKTISFNEEIPNLRHEDTLFAMDAKTNDINIQHIDNPVMHLGLETNDVFLRKSIESVVSLKLFVNDGLINPDDVTLSRVAKRLSENYISGIVLFFYKMFEPIMKRNLLSKKPSMFLFDLYRLGYYLKLKSKNR